MSVVFKQFRVYVRGAIVLVVAAAIGLVLVMNRGEAHRASVWFFGLTDDAKPINVIWLMLWTAAGTMVTWWAFSLSRGLWRDVREVKRARITKDGADAMTRRSAELDKRERRIDEKLKEAITDESEVGDELDGL